MVPDRACQPRLAARVCLPAMAGAPGASHGRRCEIISLSIPESVRVPGPRPEPRFARPRAPEGACLAQRQILAGRVEGDSRGRVASRPGREARRGSDPAFPPSATHDRQWRVSGQGPRSIGPQPKAPATPSAARRGFSGCGAHRRDRRRTLTTGDDARRDHEPAWERAPQLRRRGRCTPRKRSGPAARAAGPGTHAPGRRTFARQAPSGISGSTTCASRESDSCQPT